MTFPLLNKRYRYIRESDSNTYHVKFIRESFLEGYDFEYQLLNGPSPKQIVISALEDPWDKDGLEEIKHLFTLLDRPRIEDDPEYKELFI